MYVGEWKSKANNAHKGRHGLFVEVAEDRLVEMDTAAQEEGESCWQLKELRKGRQFFELALRSCVESQPQSPNPSVEKVLGIIGVGELEYA